MNAENFSSAFERQPSPNSPLHAERTAELSLERPQAWSQAFGYVLHDYLSSNSQPIDTAEFKTLSTAYVNWYSSDFATLYGAAIQRSQKENTLEAYEGLSRLNFHIINRAMLPIWEDTLFNKNGVQRDHIREAQTILAVHSLNLFKERQSMVAEGVYFNAEHEPYRSTTKGILNEYDTAIALLNISYKNPDIAILPGPDQFEGRAGSRNSDFIAIRRSTRQARGIQAKSGRTEDSYETYDPAYVTMIDGMHDLGNTFTVRMDPKKSRTVQVAWPGLISIEHLKNVKLDTNLKRINKRYILQAKFQAHALSKSTKPYIAQATEQISQRLLNDLDQPNIPVALSKQIK
jgi:hypothetical protein